MLDNFENRLIRGIHKSRYCASWVKAVGLDFNLGFKEWLSTLVINGEHLTKDEIQEIWYFATNGKLELQESAKAWANSPI